MKPLKRMNHEEFISFNQLADLIRDGKNLEAQLLLQNVGSCQLVDGSGNTLLHVAVQSCNEAIAQYTLDQRLIHINARDQDGRTPVMLLLQLCCKRYMKYEYKRVLQVLLKSKPNLHIRDKFGKCALQMVFEKSLDYLEIIQQFINTMKIESRNNTDALAWKLISFGCPLHHAILFKNSELTRILLDRGCPINVKDRENGQTALHVAVKLRDLRNVQLLINHGADIDALDSRNSVPMFDYDYSGSDDELKILRIILDRGSLLTTIGAGGYCQIAKVLPGANRETLLMLLDSNIDFDAKDRHGSTLMHYVVYVDNSAKLLRENADIIEKLRTKKFDVNATTESGCSLLFAAACEGLWQFVELLIDRGAQSENYSAMYVVSTSRVRQSDYKKCVELLLEHGESPQITTSDGKTILDGMAIKGCYYATEAILGQLALYEDYGFEISYGVRASIDSHEYFQDYYELCKQQLKELKLSVVHASMTLHKILDEEPEDIAFYARNDDFYRGLLSFNNEYSSNSYYSHLLRRLLKKPIECATLRRQTIDILCEIMNLNYHSNHIVVEKITGYIVNDKLLKQYNCI